MNSVLEMEIGIVVKNIGSNFRSCGPLEKWSYVWLLKYWIRLLSLRSVQVIELGLVVTIYWIRFPSLRFVREMELDLLVKNIGSAFRP